jgi:hypothetical protein
MSFDNWHDNASTWEEEDKACVSIVEDGQGWSSMDCSIKAKFVCEREAGFNHITAGVDFLELPEIKTFEPI